MKPTALLLFLIIILFSGCVETGYVTYPDNETNTTNITTTSSVSTTSTSTTTTIEETTTTTESSSDGGSSSSSDETTTTIITTTTTIKERIINVTISNIQYEDPEYVEINNYGNYVNLTDWTLEDLANHVYTFPHFILQEDSSLRVHTGDGTDNETDLFWGSGSPIWNNQGDNATLRDSEGNITAEYSYTEEETTTTSSTTTTTSTSTTITETTTTLTETTTSTSTTTTLEETTTTSTSTTSTSIPATTSTSIPATTSTTTTSSSTTTTTTIPAEHLLITEVYYDAQGDDSTREWIELYNPTASDIDLDDYTLSDNENIWDIPNITITSMDYISIARTTSGFYDLYSCNPDAEGLTLALSNAGDQLILKNNEQEIDFVAWENFVENWDIEASTNQTIKRNNAIDTDTNSDWFSNQIPDPVCA